MHVGPLLGDDPLVLAQRGDDRVAGFEPVESLERAGRRDDRALVHDHEARQVVPLADLEVVRVVRGRDLDGAGAERRVDVGVGNDGNVPVGQGQRDRLADQVRVPLVVGMHRHCGVAEHRLGARGGHHDRLVTFSVADRDELAVVVGMVDLGVGQRGQAARAPVDDPFRAVDQVVVVKAFEDRLDGAREPLVHGESLTGPVDAVAEPAHLAEDLAAVLLFPLPRLGDEFLARVVETALALGLGQVPFDECVHGDAGVIHARQPQRVVTLHALAPGQRVHQRVPERAAEVQAAGDVRRRQHDRVRRPVTARIGREVAPLDPPGVERALYVCRHVLGRQSLGARR